MVISWKPSLFLVYNIPLFFFLQNPVIFFKNPRGPLVFKGGYDALTRKQVKWVIFFQQSMYAFTLKSVSKTAKFGKRVRFSTLEIVIRV